MLALVYTFFSPLLFSFLKLLYANGMSNRASEVNLVTSSVIVDISCETSVSANNFIVSEILITYRILASNVRWLLR